MAGYTHNWTIAAADAATGKGVTVPVSITLNTQVLLSNTIPANTNLSFPVAYNVTNVKDFIVKAATNVSIYVYKGGNYKETLNISAGGAIIYPGSGAKPVVHDADTWFIKNNDAAAGDVEGMIGVQ